MIVQRPSHFGHSHHSISHSRLITAFVILCSDSLSVAVTRVQKVTKERAFRAATRRGTSSLVPHEA